MSGSNQFESHVCPYLQNRGDDKTPASFPTSANACFAGKKPKDIAYPHQELLCLNMFNQCGVYHNPELAEKVTLIDSTRNLDGVTRPSTSSYAYDRTVSVDVGGGLRRILYLLLGIAVLIVLLGIGGNIYLNRDGEEDGETKLPAGVADFISPTPSITFTPSITPTFTQTLTPTSTLTATFTPSSTVTDTFTPSNTPTPTITTTPTNTATATLTPTHTPTFTFTPSSTPTATLTFTSVPTEIGAINIIAISVTPTPTSTTTLIPPATVDPSNTNPTVQAPLTLDEVIGLQGRLATNYGIGLLTPQAWQPTTPEELALYYEYLLTIEEAFQTTALYLHYFSRASADVAPELYFREYFDQANILLDRSDEPIGLYGAGVAILEQDGRKAGYILQVSQQSIGSPFAIIRELGFIVNDMLGGTAVLSFQTELGGNWDQTGSLWIPGIGFEGFETLFPSAILGPEEDFKDTFAQTFMANLSPEISSPRYHFVLNNLPVWLAILR